MLYGDKIYNDKEFFVDMKNQFNPEMLAPVKGVKGMSDALKTFNSAANDLFSAAVLRVRQPINLSSI